MGSSKRASVLPTISQRTRGRRGRAALAAALLAILSPLGSGACGGGDGGPALADPGPSSGLTRDQRIVELSAAEKSDLCDWVAGRFGGYNRRINCGSSSVYASSAPSKSACVQTYQQANATCPATAGDIEDCTNGVVDASPCTALPLSCLAVLICGVPSGS